MANLILLIVLSIIGVTAGIIGTYFIVLNVNKKKAQEVMTFDYEQAKSFFETYRRKTPSDGQVKAMVEAYKNNK